MTVTAIGEPIVPSSDGAGMIGVGVVNAVNWIVAAELKIPSMIKYSVPPDETSVQSSGVVPVKRVLLMEQIAGVEKVLSFPNIYRSMLSVRPVMLVV